MAQGDDVQVVVFRVGGHEFAFSVFHVQRVLRYEAPAPLPRSPAFLEGVIRVGEAVVPVIDLRRRFELPGVTAGAATRTLVLEADGFTVGAVVDEVVEVLRVGAEAVTPPPAVVRGLAAEYIQGIITAGERTVVLLHTARLLTSAERIALEAVHPERNNG
jgi:purine-binding chemotaxis protein CheW